MLILLIFEDPAWAGPCTAEILKMHADLDALAASRPGQGLKTKALRRSDTTEKTQLDFERKPIGP